MPLIPENSMYEDVINVLPSYLPDIKVFHTSEELYEEGKRMGNCIFSYRDKMRFEECILLHWSYKKREYSVEVCLNQNRRFYINQIRGKHNHTCSREHREVFEKAIDDLNQYRFERSLIMALQEEFGDTFKGVDEAVYNE